MISFILLNLLVIFSAKTVVERFFAEFSTTDKILAGFSLTLAQIVLSEQILGVFSQLNLLNLIIFNTFICITFLILFRKNKEKEYTQRLDSDFKFLDSKVLLFAVSILLGFVLVKVFLSLINPTFGWDCLNYHFTQPVEWLKNHNLINPITINDDPSPEYYPINGGLIYLWFILPFKSGYMADLGQLPFYLISLIAVFAIALKAGLSKRISLMAALTFGIIPNYLKEIEIGYADIMMSSLFILSFYWLFLLHKRFKWSIFFIAAITLGFLLGIKTAAFPYTILLFLYLFYILLKSKGIKRALPYMLFTLFGLLLFGEYGFIRNFILTGNPLYPLDFTLFGKTIFKGVMPLSNYHAQWTAADFNYKKLFFSEGLGAQLVLLIAPLTIIAPIIAIIKKRVNFFVFLPIILFLMFRYFIPQLWVRFLYPYLAIGTAVGFWGLKELNIKQNIISVFFILFMLLSAAELAGHMELISSLALGLLIFSFFLLKKRYNWNIKRYIPILLVIMAGLMFLGEKKYLKEEYDRYIKYAPFPKEEAEGWKHLNEITADGANVAYVGRPQAYPLYGTKLKNNVYYISVNEKEPYLHAYKDSYYEWSPDYNLKHAVIRANENYRGNADYNVWLKNLRAKDIDFLFIYALHRIEDFPFEDSWAENHPKVFNLVFSNRLVHIYKANR
ncbi:MAG: hypothetical protein P9L98_05510 [Candidatus Kaelpia imicola]|nr:hypothetical protein [Candidatus Kaelpia imicola]